MALSSGTSGSYLGPVPDAMNPAARHYAFQRLAQFGVPSPQGADPTAAWRALSASIKRPGPMPELNGYSDPTMPKQEQGLASQILAQLVAHIGAAAPKAEGPFPMMHPGLGVPVPKTEGALPGDLHPAVSQLASGSNQSILHALARARMVAQAVQHLRQLRPAS